MWHLIVAVLCLATSSNALFACRTYENGTDNPVTGLACSGSATMTQVMLMDNRAFDDVLYEFIDVTLREIIRNGFGPLPALDPLVVGSLNLSLGGGGNGNYEPLSLKLDDIVVDDLAEFVVYNATFIFLGFKLQVALDFPKITLTGKYDMDGWLGDGLLYLFGNGDLTFSLLETSLFAEVALKGNNTWLDVDCIALDFSVKGVESNIEGLLGGGELGDFLNAVLEDAVPTLLDYIKDPLLGRVLCPLKNTANTLIDDRGITLYTLLCQVVGGTFCQDESL